MSGEAIGAILGYTGSMIGAAAQTEAVRQTNRAQRELAEYSYEQQRQMIREQNEYNSPVNQMARYKAAGLNPNLIYGQIDGGQQSEIAKFTPPQVQTPDYSNLTNFSDAIQLFLQEKKVGAEVEAINAQTQRYREETRSLMLRNQWEAFLSGQSNPDNTFSGSRRLQEYDLKLKSQGISNSLNQARYDYQKLNNQEKVFFNKFLLPLKLKEEQLKLQGMSYENIKRSIDADLWRDLRNAEIYSSPYRIFGNLVSNLGTDGSSPLVQLLKDASNPKKGYLGWGYNKAKTLWQKYGPKKKNK